MSNYKNLAILIFSTVISLLSSNSIILINARTTNKTPIKLGVTVWVPANFLAYVVQEKGIFKKNSIDVNLTLIENYGVVKSYSNGEVYSIFTVYYDAIVQHSAGVNIKIVYNVDSSSYADAIVGNGHNLSDVKGKKVSVDGINSFSHSFVLKLLENAGLNEEDLEFINVPPQNVSEELQKGHIFSGHVNTPFISDVAEKGFKILSTGSDISGIITSVLAFHSDIGKQRPLDIQNIVKSIIEAKADYNKNLEQAISIMSSKAGFSKDQIIEGINNVKLLDLYYNIQNSMNRTSTNTTSLFIIGNDITKFYAEKGVISESSNIDDLINPQFINYMFKENNIKLLI